jgi:hypothetical protein
MQWGTFSKRKENQERKHSANINVRRDEILVVSCIGVSFLEQQQFTRFNVLLEGREVQGRRFSDRT